MTSCSLICILYLICNNSVLARHIAIQLKKKYRKTTFPSLFSCQLWSCDQVLTNEIRRTERTTKKRGYVSFWFLSPTSCSKMVRTGELQQVQNTCEQRLHCCQPQPSGIKLAYYMVNKLPFQTLGSDLPFFFPLTNLSQYPT